MKTRFAVAALAGIALLAPLAGPSFAESMMMMGDVMGAEHAKDSAGEAVIHMKDGGGYVLELKNFKTAEGPDLHVLLLEDAKIMGDDTIKMAMDHKSDIDLGKLKALMGDQSYDIPAKVDVSKYHSVAIWCEKVGVLFASVDLHG